ncbi:hypothetical protein MKW92_035443, partial [Papaver armeniacum]
PRRKRASNDKRKGNGRKAKKPIKSRNKVKEVQGIATKKKEDTVDAPTVEKVLQDSHARVLKRKLVVEIMESDSDDDDHVPISKILKI